MGEINITRPADARFFAKLGIAGILVALLMAGGLGVAVNHANEVAERQALIDQESIHQFAGRF